jgi:hypothetical protein
VQNDDGYRSLHDQCGATKHPHLLSLSWNTSYPNDERSGAAALDSEGNQYQKNGCTGFLKENHFTDRSLNDPEGMPSLGWFSERHTQGAVRNAASLG